jgi:hypothetical protein
VDSPQVYALGFVCKNGSRDVLLINKRDHDIQVTLPQKAKRVQAVDEQTKAGPASQEDVDSDRLTLHPYAVAVATLE